MRHVVPPRRIGQFPGPVTRPALSRWSGGASGLAPAARRRGGALRLASETLADLIIELRRGRAENRSRANTDSIASEPSPAPLIADPGCHGLRLGDDWAESRTRWQLNMQKGGKLSYLIPTSPTKPNITTFGPRGPAFKFVRRQAALSSSSGPRRNSVRATTVTLNPGVTITAPAADRLGGA